MNKITVEHHYEHHPPLFFGVAVRDSGNGVYRWVCYGEFVRPMTKVNVAKNLTIRTEGYRVQLQIIRKL
jgi:hypothetical protein